MIEVKALEQPDARVGEPWQTWFAHEEKDPYVCHEWQETIELRIEIRGGPS